VYKGRVPRGSLGNAVTALLRGKSCILELGHAKAAEVSSTTYPVQLDKVGKGVVGYITLA
jgi:hypothetical protein